MSRWPPQGWVLEVIVIFLQCLHRIILEKRAASRWPPQGCRVGGWVLEVIVHCDTPAILQCLHRLILEKQAGSRWPPQGWVLEVIVILTQCVMCCGMWETVFSGTSCHPNCWCFRSRRRQISRRRQAGRSQQATVDWPVLFGPCMNQPLTTSQQVSKSAVGD